jgi:phosphoglycolate phosphatase
MEKRFILFDFDGVIADSFALSYDVSRIFHPELDDKAYRKLFEGNVYESLKKLRDIDIKNHGRNYFDVFVPRMKDEAHLFAGMDTVIKELHAEYTLTIVSSTPSLAISQFLERNGLHTYFSDILGQDIHTSKVEKIRMLFEKYAIHAEVCVFITDTLGDIREAKEHAMGAIGVSWGMHTHETLGQGIPFRIVDTPAELPDAISDYFARE